MPSQMMVCIQMCSCCLIYLKRNIFQIFSHSEQNFGDEVGAENSEAGSNDVSHDNQEVVSENETQQLILGWNPLF